MRQRTLSVLFFTASLLLVTLACNAPVSDFSEPAAGSPATGDGSTTAESGFRYDNIPEKNNLSQAMAQFQAVSKWSKVDLTYIFLNETSALDGDGEKTVIRQAFDLWANQTPLTFTEVTDRSQADIEVAWLVGDHRDGDPFDGPGGILAHATFPNPFVDQVVILHFDDQEPWLDSPTQDVDLLTVAAHEIGHVLGLDHSNDPAALMYPTYDGPRRILDSDDIAGVQSLYGLDDTASPQPQMPTSNDVPAAPSGETDSDGDGLSDIEEAFIVGTDFRNPDSDADGLSDGIEIYNNMNPLDPDMDKDGLRDGDEVAAGTDPFFPNQPDQGPISDELAAEIAAFLSRAVQAEIDAFIRSDPAVAAQVFTDPILQAVRDNIAELEQQGLIQVSEFDYYRSYIAAIRLVSPNQVAVDTCETWNTATYNRADRSLVSHEGPVLLPQTLFLQRVGSDWRISDVTFYDAPAFCDQ